MGSVSGPDDESTSKPASVPPGSTLAAPLTKQEHSVQKGASARAELHKHELLALLSCFLFPLAGASLLHAIRSQLSRPSEGLVSNYNLTIFLLAAEVRPSAHLFRMLQTRTLYLQRKSGSGSYRPPDGETDMSLSRRLDALEASAVALRSAPRGSEATAIASDVRRTVQPDLDALNRAVRRYEKRATVQTMQTESRLQDLEGRVSDALSLAAVAAQSGQLRPPSSGRMFLDGFYAMATMPLRVSLALVSLPAVASSMMLNWSRAVMSIQSSRQPAKLDGRSRLDLRGRERPSAVARPSAAVHYRAAAPPQRWLECKSGRLWNPINHGPHDFKTRLDPAKASVEAPWSQPAATRQRGGVVRGLCAQGPPASVSPAADLTEEARLVVVVRPQCQKAVAKPWSRPFTMRSWLDTAPGGVGLDADDGAATAAARPSGSAEGHMPAPVSASMPQHLQAPDLAYPVADPERGLTMAGTTTPTPTRAAVPARPGAAHGTLSHPSPHDSTGAPASASGARDAQPSPTTDEYAWGPSHPCFPHLNPHVPVSSPLYDSTRVIRIKRDWMIAGDLAPTFSNLYPEILDPLLPEDQFRQIVGHLNKELVLAFDPWRWRNWLDVTLSALTFWLWDDLGLTDVKRRLKAVEAWLERWNVDVGMKEGVVIVPLRRTAYMTLDIQIPDPHVGIDGSSESGVSPPSTMPLQQPLPPETPADAIDLPIMANSPR
ncbi:MAG: ras modification protein erf4 [Phylliscum demangeonii]|nr:MAG: ras modification protein erf4 [Phylliscum demangeonii]